MLRVVFTETVAYSFKIYGQLCEIALCVCKNVTHFENALLVFVSSEAAVQSQLKGKIC